MKNLPFLKILMPLQIYIKDKLLDQNGWNFDTKNVNLYSSRLDQFKSKSLGIRNTAWPNGSYSEKMPRHSGPYWG